MSENVAIPELPNILKILAAKFPGNIFFKFAYLWENVSFSLLIVLVLGILAFLACRKKSLIRLSKLKFEEIFNRSYIYSPICHLVFSSFNQPDFSISVSIELTFSSKCGIANNALDFKLTVNTLGIGGAENSRQGRRDVLQFVPWGGLFARLD